MESPPLAPVYLDNERVRLRGAAHPRVREVVAASGRAADRFDVVLLRDGAAPDAGTLVGPDDVLDRTNEPTRPIYLTCVERDADLDLDVAEEGAEERRVHPSYSGPPPGGESLGSPYARTGTDTAEPGMTGQEARQAGFGSGAGEGTSSGPRESGKAIPSAPSARSRMAAGLEDPFGREGLHGKAPPGRASRPSRRSSRGRQATAPSGTGSEESLP